MSRNGKRYDKDFKQMIVALYNSTDSTLTNIETKYGVTSATMHGLNN